MAQEQLKRSENPTPFVSYKISLAVQQRDGGSAPEPKLEVESTMIEVAAGSRVVRRNLPTPQANKRNREH